MFTKGTFCVTGVSGHLTLDSELCMASQRYLGEPDGLRNSLAEKTMGGYTRRGHGVIRLRGDTSVSRRVARTGLSRTETDTQPGGSMAFRD